MEGQGDLASRQVTPVTSLFLTYLLSLPDPPSRGLEILYLVHLSAPESASFLSWGVRLRAEGLGEHSIWDPLPGDKQTHEIDPYGIPFIIPTSGTLHLVSESPFLHSLLARWCDLNGGDIQCEG